MDRSNSNRSAALTKPQRSRSCTDVPVLLLFVLFWCGMILVAAFSITHGDPLRLIYGVDSFGNTCGRENNRDLNLSHSAMNLTDRPHLFAMEILRPFESTWICVKQCPDRDMFSMLQVQQYAIQEGIEFCLYGVPYASYTNRTLYPSSTLGPCPMLPVYNSTTILNRCIPNAIMRLHVDIVRQIFGFLNTVDTFEMILADLAIAYKEIIALCVLAFCIALIMVFILRFVAGVVVYFIFILVSLASVGVTALLWWGFWQLKQTLDTKAAATDGAAMLLSENTNEHAICIYAIVASIVTAILLLVICCLWRSTGEVTRLFAEAARALSAMPCLLLTPFTTCLAMALLFIYWIFVLLSLATAAEISQEKRSTYGAHYVESVIVRFNVSSPVRYMWWFHLVGGIWTAEFILACQQMVVAGSIAIWYFARDKDDLGYPMWISIKRLILYHLGSISLGSFIITLVKLPRLVLMYIHEKLRLSQNVLAQYLLKCCICCLWILECCLKYLHHNAYTIIAIEGKSFCPAARQAVGVLASNADTVAVLNTVGDFVLFLAKVAVAALSGIAAFFVLNKRVHFYAVPMLVVVVFAYLIAHCFFSVYEMAIDTLLLCYSEDVDYSDSIHEERRFADERFEKVMLDLGCAKPMNRTDYDTAECADMSRSIVVTNI